MGSHLDGPGRRGKVGAPAVPYLPQLPRGFLSRKDPRVARGVQVIRGRLKVQKVLGRPEQGKLEGLGGVLPCTVGKSLRSREATKKKAPGFSVGHLKVGRQERQGVPLTPATDLQTVCLGRLVGLLVLREGIRRHFRVGRRNPGVDISDRAQVRQATRELPQPPARYRMS